MDNIVSRLIIKFKDRCVCLCKKSVIVHYLGKTYDKKSMRMIADKTEVKSFVSISFFKDSKSLVDNYAELYKQQNNYSYYRLEYETNPLLNKIDGLIATYYIDIDFLLTDSLFELSNFEQWFKTGKEIDILNLKKFKTTMGISNRYEIKPFAMKYQVGDFYFQSDLLSYKYDGDEVIVPDMERLYNDFYSENKILKGFNLSDCCYEIVDNKIVKLGIPKNIESVFLKLLKHKNITNEKFYVSNLLLKERLKDKFVIDNVKLNVFIANVDPFEDYVYYNTNNKLHVINMGPYTILLSYSDSKIFNLDLSEDIILDVKKQIAKEILLGKKENLCLDIYFSTDLTYYSYNLHAI